MSLSEEAGYIEEGAKSDTISNKNYSGNYQHPVNTSYNPNFQNKIIMRE